MPGYDIIGDIHGHADALEALLLDLGYRNTGGSWRQPGRKVVFLGDFIDRGPRQIDSVMIPRRMIEEDRALGMLGNHEFNALAFATRGPNGWLRVRGSKNIHQHKAFLDAVGVDSPLHRELVDWFRTLPLWLEVPGAFRAVHACWDEESMEVLAPALDEEHRILESASVDIHARGTALNDAVEKVLKGLEVPLPPEVEFHDEDGIRRHNARVRWWDESAITYRQAALVDEMARRQLPDEEIGRRSIAPSSGTPVFFGHYWMTGSPVLQSDLAACLDFSVAADGVLCAYSFDGEPFLLPEKLSWASPGCAVEHGASTAPAA